MFNLSELISKMVIGVSDGKNIGTLENAIFDKKLNKIKYLVVFNENCEDKILIPSAYVLSAKQNAIMVKAFPVSIVSLHSNSPLKAKVFSHDGNEIAIVEDIVLYKDLAVKHLLLSDDSELPPNNIISFSNEALIVCYDNELLDSLKKIKVKKPSAKKINTENNTFTLKNLCDKDSCFLSNQTNQKNVETQSIKCEGQHPEVTEQSEISEQAMQQPEVTEPAEISEQAIHQSEVTEPAEISEQAIHQSEVTEPTEISEQAMQQPEVTEPAIQQDDVAEDLGFYRLNQQIIAPSDSFSLQTISDIIDENLDVNLNDNDKVYEHQQHCEICCDISIIEPTAENIDVVDVCILDMEKQLEEQPIFTQADNDNTYENQDKNSIAQDADSYLSKSIDIIEEVDNNMPEHNGIPDENDTEIEAAEIENDGVNESINGEKAFDAEGLYLFESVDDTITYDIVQKDNDSIVENDYMQDSNDIVKNQNDYIPKDDSIKQVEGSFEQVYNDKVIEKASAVCTLTAVSKAEYSQQEQEEQELQPENQWVYLKNVVPPFSYLIGRRVTKDILNQRDEVIVKKDTVITTKHIDECRKYGKIILLARNAKTR